MNLEKLPNSNRSEIKHHLRRSFTDGDVNYAAQFWNARHIYIDGEVSRANELFEKLGNLNIDSKTKHLSRGKFIENGKEKRFSGIISHLETNYAYIIRDGLQDKVYAYAPLSDEKEWSLLRYHKRVSFELGFNCYGPIALNILQG